LQRRLDEVRGGSPRRSPTVRALAAFAGRSSCRLAALGFAAGVDFDRLLAGTRHAMPFGQSPFAFQRGNSFEASLRADGHAATLALLRDLPGFPAGPATVANIRAVKGMPERAAETLRPPAPVVNGRPDAPHLIDGAVLCGDVGGVRAYFEADAVAAFAGGLLRVGEVKSFPKVDGRVDPDKLGAAFDQAAIYLLLLRAAVASLGASPGALVSPEALLITPLNVAMRPALSRKDVSRQEARARRLLAAVPRVADVIAAAPAGTSFGPVADVKAAEPGRLHALNVLADKVGTDYAPDCLSGCGNARFCRERAFHAGAPCLTGSAAGRLIPNVATLHRAEELTRGVAPTPGEAAAAIILARAGRLHDSP